LVLAWLLIFTMPVWILWENRSRLPLANPSLFLQAPAAEIAAHDENPMRRALLSRKLEIENPVSRQRFECFKSLPENGFGAVSFAPRLWMAFRQCS